MTAGGPRSRIRMSLSFIRRSITGCCALATLVLGAAPVAHAAATTANGDVGGTVSDSSSGQRLQNAEVSVAQGTRVVANTQTDAFGRYTVHNLASGSYMVTARFLG